MIFGSFSADKKRATAVCVKYDFLSHRGFGKFVSEGFTIEIFVEYLFDTLYLISSKRIRCHDFKVKVAENGNSSHTIVILTSHDFLKFGKVVMESRSTRAATKYFCDYIFLFEAVRGASA
jgi:hypothetical protein